MYKYLFLLLTALLPAPLAAQEDDVDTITVTADGLGTAITNTGQAVTLIDEAEIDEVQGADIARILRRAPATSIARNGPVGSFTGVRVRGAQAEQLLVLVDGVRVSDPAAPGGGYDFGNLLGGNVIRIDLLRGSNSIIWGSDAIGGVIDITTRATSGAEASVEYGARDTLLATGAAGLSGDSYFVGLDGSFYDSDGFSAAANGTEADGFRQYAVGGSAFYDLTDEIELFARGRYAEGDLEIDGFPAPLFALADTAETQETRQYSGAAGATYRGLDLTLRAAYSFSDTERDNFDSALGSDPTFSSDGHQQRVSVRGEYRIIGGLALDFGGEHEWSSYRTAFDAGEDTAITGGYGQLGWELGRLAVHAGARVDDHRRFGTATSFGGDASYRLGGDWRVRASVGEGFKAPTLFQLFSDFGNEALSPERSTSYDLGIERGARGEGLYLAATAFRRDSEDLIDFVSCFGVVGGICTDRPFGTYDNVGRARAQGFELELAARPGERWDVFATYSLVDTEDRATGNDLARRPRHLLSAGADWTSPLAGLVLGGELRLVGDSFDDAANTVPLDGYALVDVRASVPVGETFELFGRVENLFDVDYRTAAGYGSPGRGAFVGVRVRM